MSNEDATKRLLSKKQTLDDAYAAPANFLEIDVINPITHGIGNKRYTDYEVRMKVNISLCNLLCIYFWRFCLFAIKLFSNTSFFENKQKCFKIIFVV